MNRDEMVDNIVDEIGILFRCFGKGSVHTEFIRSPITEATKNDPLQFALGVDVRDVVNFVLDQYSDLKDIQELRKK